MGMTNAANDLLPVPMLDFSREYASIREEVLAAITEVCDSQRFILGPAVYDFEMLAAAACETNYAVGCASGTDALWLALASTGVGPGDTVVTSPFSFFATVSAILRAGARPVLADIGEASFNLCPDSARSVIDLERAAGQKVAAVMPVHLYGQCADMTSFSALAAERDIKVVEDAAQAFGARWDGTCAGSMGDAAAFSFYPTKNLAAFGDAGMVTTNDEASAERCRVLRAHGMHRRYFHDEVGWNARMDSIQAAVLQVRLKRVSAGNTRRQGLAGLYHESFRHFGLAGASTADGVVLPSSEARANHVYHQYVIRAPRRDALRDFLTTLGIGSEIYYPLCLHEQTALAGLGYKRGTFPIAEKAADEVLALPMYPELRDDEVSAVVEGVRRFYAEN